MRRELRPGEVDERTEFQKLVDGRFRRRRAKIGDVVELPTARGLAYAQYTHEHPVMTSVLRVFEGVHDVRPDALEALVAGPLLFETLLPFRGLAYSGGVEIVGNVPVPEFRRPFPLFRSIAPPALQEVLSSEWFLWDGDQEWSIGKLAPEQESLPFRCLPSYGLLIEWIEEGRRNQDIYPPA